MRAPLREPPLSSPVIWASRGAIGQLPVSPEPRLEFAFEELVLLAPAMVPSKTPCGSRNMIPIVGGTFEGPASRARSFQAGGTGNWCGQTERRCQDDYILKTEDGVIVNVLNTGALCMPNAGQPSKPVRTLPCFEVPPGKHERLGQTALSALWKEPKVQTANPL